MMGVEIAESGLLSVLHYSFLVAKRLSIGREKMTES